MNGKLYLCQSHSQGKRKGCLLRNGGIPWGNVRSAWNIKANSLISHAINNSRL